MIEKRDIEISIIASLNNEEDNVIPLYARLKGILEPIKKTYEIIFVDDGSVDGTSVKLREIYERDVGVSFIRLDRNYGQMAGFIAGINASRGGIIITMDGDLQHDPAVIPRLLEKIQSGFDIVVTKRAFREDHFFTRVLPAVVAKRIISFFFGVGYRDINASFCAYQSNVLKDIVSHGEAIRFVSLLNLKKELRIAEIDIKTYARKFGKTHFYFLNRLRRLIKDLRLLFIIRNEKSFKKEAVLFYKISQTYVHCEA